jgi:WD40 repeat protein/anti-sigma factor RsiW
MNATLLRDCDQARLTRLLEGALSPEEERQVQAHLEACPACRTALEQLAAGPEAWDEAQRLLRPPPFSSPEASHPDDNSPLEGGGRPPVPIQAVLDTLAPTDDPQMLGRLGGYEVAGVVGAGGMGVVLKAIDKSLDRTVAIKVLAPHLAASGAARRRFAREAKAAAAVLHPNVIAIHHVESDEPLPYLVMPYRRGTSLQKRLDDEGPLPAAEILRIGSQIAAGLAAAHAQGLVHRDIKPANILLDDGVERVTITDFGLARAVDDASITQSGALAGTPQFMSPEQARGEPLDGRSDLFSLGSVLYAAGTGRPPFRAETTYGVIRRITDDEPAPIRDLNPDIPPWLVAIIARLMAKPADQRYQSAGEVADLLAQCLAHVQQPATAPLPESLRAAMIGGRSRSPSFAWLGGLAMLVITCFAALSLFLWQTAEPPEIAGRWTGAGWGQVELRQREPGNYTGTYTDTFGKSAGTLELAWSRLERRFKGTWQEGTDRFGTIAVRLVDGEVRGAWTTSRESRISPGNPELADLAWVRVAKTGQKTVEESPADSPAESGKPPPLSVRSTLRTPAPTPQLAPKKASSMPRRLQQFPVSHRVQLVACSPDGRLIAVANGNPTFVLQTSGTSRLADDWKPIVQVLDAATGKSLVSLKLSTVEEDAVLAATERVFHFEVTGLAFSPDGQSLAVGTSIGQVKLYSVRTGEMVRALDDREPRLGDKETPESWKPMVRGLGSTRSVAFSPDGNLLAACGESFADFSDVFDGIESLGLPVSGPGRLKVWDVKSGALKHDLPGHSQVFAAAFSGEGSLLASTGRWTDSSDHGNGVLVWNAQSGEKVRAMLIEANGGTHQIDFAPGRKLAAIGSIQFDKENDTGSSAIAIAFPQSGITEWQRTFDDWAIPSALPGGKSIAVLCGGASIQVIDAESGQTQGEIRPAKSPEGTRWTDLAIAPSGSTLVVGGVLGDGKGLVEVWTLGDGNAPAVEPAAPDSGKQ